MEFAYANVEHDEKAGRWVIKIHDKPMEFFLDPGQAESMEINGDLRDFAIYTFMVMFNPDDQFAFILTAKRVAKMREAELELHRSEPKSTVEAMNEQRCDDCEELMYDCACKSFKHEKSRTSKTFLPECRYCEDKVPMVSVDGLCIDCHGKHFSDASFITAS